MDSQVLVTELYAFLDSISGIDKGNFQPSINKAPIWKTLGYALQQIKEDNQVGPKIVYINPGNYGTGSKSFEIVASNFSLIANSTRNENFTFSSIDVFVSNYFNIITRQTTFKIKGNYHFYFLFFIFKFVFIFIFFFSKDCLFPKFRKKCFFCQFCF